MTYAVYFRRTKKQRWRLAATCNEAFTAKEYRRGLEAERDTLGRRLKRVKIKRITNGQAQETL